MENTIAKKFRRTLLLFLTLFFVLSHYACFEVDNNLNKALEYAGSNKTELLKVLQHYKECDAEKYNAACFLIKNMPYYGFYEGEALSDYLRYFETYATKDMTPQEVIDSLEKTYGKFDIRRLNYKKDIQTIDSAFLVNHIEWAFKVWKEQPWGKNVTFRDFCEYILPYRIDDEPLSLWRKDLYDRFNPLLDSLRSQNIADDPLEAAQVLIDYFNKEEYRFTGLFPQGPSLGPIVLEWKVGSCREFADMMVYVMRAVGIPCGVDRVLQRADDNASHFWNFTLDKNGNTYMTEFPFQHRWSETYKFTNPKGKVYRVTFGLNEEKADEVKEIPKVYPTFKYPFIYDVTSLYAQTYTVNIPRDSIHTNVKDNELIYLCFADRQQWKPVDYTFLTECGACFKNVEAGVVGVLATWNGQEFQALIEPFLIERDTGKLRYFIPKKELEAVNLYCKFYLEMQDYIYSRMRGGVIEGSNLPDFSWRDTLLQVVETPKRLYTVAHLKNSKAYRYVRYKGGNESFCNIAELSFYENSKDTVSLKGHIIGTPGCFKNDGRHEYTNVFDGDPNTSFDYIHPDSGWAGLDLGSPHIIRKVVYTPRNYVNFIYKGDMYELFYWNRGEWVTVGKQRAETDSLIYTVPQNALLFLKNHSHGKDERIFEYQDGKQIFW